MTIKRRSFISKSAVFAAAGLASPVLGDGKVKAVAPATKEPTASAEVEKPLIASAPMLQNPAETSMGIAWAVSAMANGFVDYSETTDMSCAMRVKSGGYRFTGMNDTCQQVRLTGLKPATRYWYRIGADRISYKGGYKMSIVGTEIDPLVRSFTTPGAAAVSHFCVMNDTHMQWKSFEMVTQKLAELAPPLVVWNGDASNTSETFEAARDVFLTPKVTRKDYAAECPVLFTNGNHDYRGLFNRHLEDVFMFRQPEERDSKYWDLGRNFAVRQGDIAMIGLDTGEDKPDRRDVFAGLFNCEPYRRAQTAWLADTLARPEIASAPYIVVFCHIPLFDPRTWAHPGGICDNGGGKYMHDFALWEKSCAEMWGPLLVKAGVQVVVAAHEHEFRYDAPEAGRPWAQIVGGGPELGFVRGKQCPARFPTVIDGRVEGGNLKIVVHDVFSRRIVGNYTYAPRV